MSPPASERAARRAPHAVNLSTHLRPSDGARTAQRAVPTFNTLTAHHSPLG
jgi:hypothetical protein